MRRPSTLRPQQILLLATPDVLDDVGGPVRLDGLHAFAQRRVSRPRSLDLALDLGKPRARCIIRPLADRRPPGSPARAGPRFSRRARSIRSASACASSRSAARASISAAAPAPASGSTAASVWCLTMRKSSTAAPRPHAMTSRKAIRLPGSRRLARMAAVSG